MAFAKGLDLLRLADFATASHLGVSLEQIRDEFGVSHRTAQRMTDALEDAFPNAVQVIEDRERRRRWMMREVPLARLALSGEDELEALDLAVSRLRGDGDGRQAAALSALRHRLVAALPPRAARRYEADAEAMLEAHGMAARPGPNVEIDDAVAAVIAEALRGPSRLAFGYRGQRRLVEPYGILLGARRYLVARLADADSAYRHFRVDLIEAPEDTGVWFARDPGFTLADHAARAFGSYQDEDEYGEVVWRFRPEASDRAAEWRFHPRQRTRHLDDGSLEVRFNASGWLEMAWHLYQWGNAVEVIAPEGLRVLVEGHQRCDFPSPP